MLPPVLTQFEEEETPEGLNIVEAAEYDIQRIHKYLNQLAEVADEVFTAEETANAAGQDESVDASRRRLQQQDDGSYLGAYATAFRFIFSNIFDFFRDFGELLDMRLSVSTGTSLRV